MSTVWKIHFVQRFDENNIGDMSCSPSLYYDFFQKYNCVWHDVERIKWPQIAPNDLVILGGGGLFSLNQSMYDSIERLMDSGASLVCWAAGFNAHRGAAPVIKEVDFSRFQLIGIRDFSHPSELRYLPDVSCKASCLDWKLPITREIGLIEHPRFGKIENLPYDKIDNTHSLEKIAAFIASSGVIIASSYHCLYWVMLMGKPAICINPFSDKFNYYKYNPIFFSGNLEADITATQSHSSYLAECRTLNDSFFKEVRALVRQLAPARGIFFQPVGKKYFQVVYTGARSAGTELETLVVNRALKRSMAQMEEKLRKVGASLDARIQKLEKIISRQGGDGPDSMRTAPDSENPSEND